MKLKSVISTFIFLLFLQSLLAQVKNEKEERIKQSDFPEIAKTIVNILPDKCKRIKFYKEKDNDKTSFEVKFKYNNKRYSLEFSEAGQIEDIEVVTKLKTIKDHPKKQIENYFKNSYSKYKIIKIQKQFVYTTEYSATQFVLDVLLQNSKAKTNYEIIAEVKSQKERDMAEFTFSTNGQFIDLRILKSTSYEHVLY